MDISFSREKNKVKKAHENFMSLPIKVIVMNYFFDENLCF
jgi:hypothetical protein